MRIGFIGAGKVGCTLGKYFAVHGVEVVGYYDKVAEAAVEAAAFVGAAEDAAQETMAVDGKRDSAAQMRYEAGNVQKRKEAGNAQHPITAAESGVAHAQGRPQAYAAPEQLVVDCDAVFLTVPDGLITATYEALRSMDAPETAGIGDRESMHHSDALGSDALPHAQQAILRGKILCHCSGSISSREAFPGIEETGAWACSVHPLFAVSSRFETWKEIGKAVFTLEGRSDDLGEKSAGLKEAPLGLSEDAACLRDASNCSKGNADRLSQMRDFLVGTGLRVQVIDPAAKTKYHLAAVYASNLVCGLLGEAQRLLQDCGFPGETAIQALAPLIQGNVTHVLEVGPAAALTGPVERGDLTTLRKHLTVCDSAEDRQRYLLLSQLLLQLAREKNPQRDYGELEAFLSAAEAGNVV